MAEELQGLLDRIQEEGIKKADGEKDKIISAAKKEAEDIVKKAEEDAASIRKKAEEDAKRSEERAKAAIQQAARDIILSLREDLLTRLKDVVKDCIGNAMTPDLMGKILLEMTKSYREKNPDSNPGIEVLITSNDVEKMEALFKGSLVEDLKSKPEISVGHDFTGGLKIGFKGSDVFFDFSDDAIADLITGMIGPKLAALLEDS